MSYVNIYDVLPEEIVKQVQEYVDGIHVYIPRKTNNRKPWGTNTNAKQLTTGRNQQIRTDYQNGLSVQELARHYFLAEKTIQKIIYLKQENE